LGIKHMVVCVNKMDLVGWKEERYEEIVDAFRSFSSRLDIPDIRFIPISALQGDNVVDASVSTPWYDGPTLLNHLEQVHVAADRNLQDCRFPVQYVIRPQTDAHRDFRGYAGRVTGGVFKVGDKVLALPSGIASRVKSIAIGEAPVEQAFPPQSVVMTLEDDIDLSRGDMLVRENNQPESTQDLDVRVCWLSDRPMRRGAKFELRHTSREVKAVVKEVVYKLDINTLHRMEDDLEVGMNDIARMRIRTSAPVLVDDYRRNRATGSFILVDPTTRLTVAAGVIYT